MKKIFLISTTVILFVACSHKMGSSNSNTTAAADKPKVDANAMYTSDIKAILEAKCTPCHFPDKGGNKAAFDSYAGASNNIAEMIDRVQRKPDERGYMPFRGKHDPVTPDEIAKLKAWQAALGK